MRKVIALKLQSFLQYTFRWLVVSELWIWRRSWSLKCWLTQSTWCCF